MREKLKAILAELRSLDYGQLNAVTVAQATERDYPCRASSGISPELDWNFTT